MKADTEVPIALLISVILAISVIAVLIIFFLQGEVSASPGGYVNPKEKPACSSDKDCIRGMCASLNGRPNACICLSDEDCGSTDYTCIENKCQEFNGG